MKELQADSTNDMKDFILTTTHFILGTPELMFQLHGNWVSTSSIPFIDLDEGLITKMISEVKFTASTRCMIRGGVVYYKPIKDKYGSTVNIRSLKSQVKQFIYELISIFNKHEITKQKLACSMIFGGDFVADLNTFCDKWDVTSQRIWSLLGLKECDKEACIKAFGMAFYKIDGGALVYTNNGKIKKLSDDEFSTELLNKQMLSELMTVNSFD